MKVLSLVMVPSGNEGYRGKLLAIEMPNNSNDPPRQVRHFEDSAAGLYHPHMSYISRMGFCAAAGILAAAGAQAQPRALTAADYARAEKFMTYNTTPLVLRSGVRATWLPGDPGDRFW